VSKGWPRLGDFPLTNAIGVSMLVAWLGTGIVCICFAIASTVLSCPALLVPAAWWDALKWFSAYAFAQFAAKRASHEGLWKKPGNGISAS
jgi:hypothetical protein